MWTVFSLWIEWDVATEKAEVSYRVYIHVTIILVISYSLAREVDIFVFKIEALLLIYPTATIILRCLLCVLLYVLGFYQRKAKNKRTKTLRFQSCCIFWIIINFLSLKNPYNSWKV